MKPCAHVYMQVDPGETPEQALVRELKEELDIEVQVKDLKPLTFASHTYPTFHLLMPLYECKTWVGTARGVEGQAITWADSEQLTADPSGPFPLTPADIPLVADVLRSLRQS
jgi:8-oxo-dGTP diphosphatase